MSKPTYRELATDFDLWCSFVRFENPVSEREFGEMSVDEKLDILRGCFGSRSALDEADFPKNETDDDQKPDPDQVLVVNQKYQSSTDPEATLALVGEVVGACDFGGLTLDTPQNLDFALQVLAWGELDSL